MDATLVRNLSDHRGNNLLHVVAGAGDADALAWLCAHFKPQIQDALLDENKRGLTPIVAAIQVRQVQIRFQTRWGSATKYPTLIAVPSSALFSTWARFGNQRCGISHLIDGNPATPAL